MISHFLFYGQSRQFYFSKMLVSQRSELSYFDMNRNKREWITPKQVYHQKHVSLFVFLFSGFSVFGYCARLLMVDIPAHPASMELLLKQVSPFLFTVNEP